MRLQRIHDLLTVGVECSLIRFLRKADKDLVLACLVVALDRGVLDARCFHRLAQPVDVGGLIQLHFHLSPAAEINAQRNRAANLANRVSPMVCHGDNSGNAEDQ